jgi:hypothetical protein
MHAKSVNRRQAEQVRSLGTQAGWPVDIVGKRPQELTPAAWELQ